MQVKLKTALAITLLVTAIMLVMSFAFIPSIAQGMGDNMQNSEQQGNPSEEVGEAIGIGIGVIFVTLIALLLGLSWLATALMFLIFIPIVLTSKTEEKLKTRIKALLILTIIFGIFVVVTMAVCWSLAIYSTSMMIVMAITDLCFVACVITQIAAYRMLRKYVNQAT